MCCSLGQYHLERCSHKFCRHKMASSVLSRSRYYPRLVNQLQTYLEYGSEFCPSCFRRFCSPAGQQPTQPPKPPAPPPKEGREELTQEHMKKAAESVSAGMFPWERRQMDGGGTPLSSFERAYWIAFGGAVLFLIGSNGYRYWNSRQEVKVDEDTARKKDELALKLALGEINVLQSDDIFEGMTPKELTQFVEGARQRVIDKRNQHMDEYDGLSPEEINALADSRQAKSH